MVMLHLNLIILENLNQVSGIILLKVQDIIMVQHTTVEEMLQIVGMKSTEISTVSIRMVIVSKEFVLFMMLQIVYIHGMNLQKTEL